MIDRAHLDEYIAKRGPYLYHRAPHDALPHIAAQGLLPWDHDERADLVEDWEEGSPTVYADSRMTPRFEHVYVGDGGYVRRYDGVTLRIDLRRVDPLTIDADEDHFDVVRRHDVPVEFSALLSAPPREWGSSAEYLEPDCPDCAGAGEIATAECESCFGSGKDIHADPRDEAALGEWADFNAQVLDSPEGVAYSLACGSVAIRGHVPAAAIEIDPARIVPSDYPALARAFADQELTLAPFTIHHEGQELTVVADSRGQIVAPSATEVPERYHLERYVAEARGERLVQLFNAHELAPRLTPPELGELGTKPALASAPSSEPSRGWAQ